MAITFDPAKRDWTLRERGLDFLLAEEVFAGVQLSFEDERFDYRETRIVTVGMLDHRMVIVVWTARGKDRHIISMRKANAREQARYAPLLRSPVRGD
ncbi:BrnT family toxin [Enterovirga sp. CN4-39]|uniref:BrnT family toxin n=1 Tax=Enterovirga sp. CN4-39 TaxID=3400910 RepID=UPI003C0049BE